MNGNGRLSAKHLRRICSAQAQVLVSMAKAADRLQHEHGIAAHPAGAALMDMAEDVLRESGNDMLSVGWREQADAQQEPGA